MPTIRRHVPNCVDMDDECNPIEFSTVEELLDISFVKSFKDYDDFHKFSIADRFNGPSLMAEYNKGKKWWVIGHIDDASSIDLPDWKAVD